MYTGQSKYFMESFQDATSKPLGYLIVDLKANQKDLGYGAACCLEKNLSYMYLKPRDFLRLMMSAV